MSLWSETCREWRRIFSHGPAFAVLVLAALVYAVFYPQPYVNETLRRVPVAVVDADNTTASRDLSRRLDATADVAVAMVLPDMAQARTQVFARTIHGIVFIPRHFERDLLHGRASPVALYADASYFLIYQRVSLAVTAVARAVGAEAEGQGLVAAGMDPVLAQAVADPMPLTAQPLFNPQGGYATYVLPAAFVLILQQLLLMGVGLLGTSADPVKGDPAATAGPLVRVVGRLLAYLAVESVIVPFYLIGLPFLYGIPRLGSPGAVLLVAVPFIIAVATLGMVLARLIRTPLMVQLTMAALGLPLFFLAGFSWPAEAMPHAVRIMAMLIPSTSAMDALVRVGQMGATLDQVGDRIAVLSALALAYGGVAVWLDHRTPSRHQAAPGEGQP